MNWATIQASPFQLPQEGARAHSVPHGLPVPSQSQCTSTPEMQQLPWKGRLLRGAASPGGEGAEAHPSPGLRAPPAECRPHRPLTERWPGEALDTCRYGTHYRRESVTQGREGRGQSQEEGEVARVSESSSPPRCLRPRPVGPDTSHMDGPQD